MILFKKIDANNDNKISRDAFIEHMKLSKFIDLGLWDALFDALVCLMPWFKVSLRISGIFSTML